jgi:catechol 2,3-dioxygenase-like lactoylglutathione lyase family enzyme
MISRFDHTVIAVRDLDAAIERYRALGFEVNPGGRHTGLGTYNAIIRFGLDYIELISVYDANEAATRGSQGDALLDYLKKREGGLVGYALATTNIEQDAERFRTTNLAALGPFPMQRMRPDGHLLSWRLLVPEGVSWCRPWPFLIQWDVPDEQRLSWEKPGMHPIGVIGWVGIAIAVRDLEKVIDLYQHQLGIPLSHTDTVSTLAARRATFNVGSSQIDLLTPLDNGPVQRALDEVGEGPFALRLASRDLDRTRAYLAQHAVNFQMDATDPSALLLSPVQALGARLVLVAQQS